MNTPGIYLQIRITPHIFDKNWKSVLHIGMSLKTRKGYFVENTGDEKSHDTVLLTRGRG